MEDIQVCELEYIGETGQVPLKCHVVSIENSSPHWHHEYEIFFVLRGAVSIHNEGLEWRMNKGDMVLFNACDIHSINKPELGNLCLVLQWSPGLLSEVYKSSFRFELNTCADIRLPDDAVDTFRRNLAQIGLLLHEKPNGYQFYIRGYLYQFIGTMFKYLRYTVDAVPKQPDHNYLKDFNAVKQYIKQHFTEEINTRQLCHDLGMSRATLYRVLKEASITSYKSLVNFYRVEYAKDLLRNSNVSISYIASASGFESDSSFYRIFKDVTSASPIQYRTAPHTSETPVGIQGYVNFNMPQAVSVLKEYCFCCPSVL